MAADIEVRWSRPVGPKREWQTAWLDAATVKGSEAVVRSAIAATVPAGEGWESSDIEPALRRIMDAHPQ